MVISQSISGGECRLNRTKGNGEGTAGVSVPEMEIRFVNEIK